MISTFVEKENIFNDRIIINDKKNIHHIVNVFRTKVGDKIRIVDGEFEYLSEILRIEKQEMELLILEKNEDKYSLNVEIDIAMAVIKNDNFNLVIQKLTEIGVNSIIPMITTNTVVKVNEKKEKWEQIVLESMKQCQAIKKTKICDIIKLKDLKFDEYDKVIFVYEKSEKSQKLIEILKKEYRKILFIIGPEGGFTKEESEFLAEHSSSISLGNRILRAETAAIYVASVIANIYL